jgi:hypothetical protein
MGITRKDPGGAFDADTNRQEVILADPETLAAQAPVNLQALSSHYGAVTRDPRMDIAALVPGGLRIGRGNQ